MPNTARHNRRRAVEKKSGLCHSYRMPTLIDQPIPHVRREPSARFAGVGFNSSQTILAYDVPHVISSFPVFCIHYNIRKGLCQALSLLNDCNFHIFFSDHFMGSIIGVFVLILFEPVGKKIFRQSFSRRIIFKDSKGILGF